MNLHTTQAPLETTTEAWFYNSADTLQLNLFPEGIVSRARKAIDDKAAAAFEFFNGSKRYVLISTNTELTGDEAAEYLRVRGNELNGMLTSHGETAVVLRMPDNADQALLLLEGFMLGAYRYTVHFSKPDKKKHPVLDVYIPGVDAVALHELHLLVQAVNFTRDLVNEPNMTLSATDLAQRIQQAGDDIGFTVEVLNQARIEALKMGGLLAVNKGSVDPPTFTIMEYKPQGYVNTRPYVLVGKGVVYDTGGLSLKPTPNSMDLMKCDMAGAAAVAGAICAIASNRLPVHVVGLVPATDNRPGGDAYAPGDVITMMDGTTVEVLNTDAEGRLILADALAYAKRYNPELVIDLATLTGAAARAIGKFASVGMSVKSRPFMDRLMASGFSSGDRVVEFPMWAEYKEEMKSTIADLKNIGSGDAGMITAGKFLEHFTDYPYIHLDIAGPAFLTSGWRYHQPGATGTGVRLLYHFFKTISAQ